MLAIMPNDGPERRPARGDRVALLRVGVEQGDAWRPNVAAVLYEGRMDLIDVEREMADLDAVYQPVATMPIDHGDPHAFKNIGVRIETALAKLDVTDRAEALLRAVIDLYAAGNDTTRTAVRGLFDRYTSFRWAAHLPRDWNTAVPSPPAPPLGPRPGRRHARRDTDAPAPLRSGPAGRDRH
jgi:hypothetical protein